MRYFEEFLNKFCIYTYATNGEEVEICGKDEGNKEVMWEEYGGGSL